jgi:hypothetical protein
MIDEKIKMLFSSYWDEELTEDEEDRLFSILHAVKEARVVFKDYYHIQVAHLRSVLKITFPKMLDQKLAQATGTIPVPDQIPLVRSVWTKRWSVPIPVAIAAIFLVAVLTVPIYQGLFPSRVNSLSKISPTAQNSGSTSPIFTADELDAAYLSKIKSLKKVKITEMDRLPLSTFNE